MTCCLRPCWLSLGSWPPHPTSGEPVCGEPAASRIATPPWAAEQQARWPNHSCIDSLCKRGQSPLHICWLARWGPGRPAPLGASRCVESLRRRTSRRRRGQPGGRTRWTSTEGQAERLLTHSASCTVPPRSLTIPAAPTRGWSSACVDARLVIRLRLWLGKQDALDKHLVHRCELLALHYACRRAPRPSQPPPELRSALSGMMPRPRDAQLCPAPPLPTALHHPGSFLSALTERVPPATRH